MVTTTAAHLGVLKVVGLVCLKAGHLGMQMAVHWERMSVVRLVDKKGKQWVV